MRAVKERQPATTGVGFRRYILLSIFANPMMIPRQTMKILVSSTAPALDAAFNPRFGRADCFILIDTVSGEWSAHENPALESGHGAGIQAAQIASQRGVEAAVSGHFGPKAHDTLEAAEIRMFEASGGTVAEVVEAFKSGSLKEI
jgi:predicted Fe-Mo cluster-binding NifX family protein